MPLTNRLFYFYCFALTLNALVVLCFLIEPLSFITWANIWDFLHQGKSATIASINTTFDPTALLKMKVFLSRGILLFLTFWTSCFVLLIVKYKGNDPFFRKLSLGLLIAMLMGTIGIYAHGQSKLKTYTPFNPAFTLPLHLGDELQQNAYFLTFDEKFLKYLKMAEHGEIKLSIINTNALNDNHEHDLTRALYHPLLVVGGKSIESSMNVYLEPQHVTELLKTKRLSYKYKVRRAGLIYIYLRAAGQPMTSRKDELMLNNKEVPLETTDHTSDYLPLIFRFEERSGKPIIVFY